MCGVEPMKTCWWHHPTRVVIFLLGCCCNGRAGRAPLDAVGGRNENVWKAVQFVLDVSRRSRFASLLVEHGCVVVLKPVRGAVCLLPTRLRHARSAHYSGVVPGSEYKVSGAAGDSRCMLTVVTV